MANEKEFPHAAAEEAGYYACTGWAVEDVQEHYPGTTVDQALDYLRQHEKHLRDTMICAGNDYLDFNPPGGE